MHVYIRTGNIVEKVVEGRWAVSGGEVVAEAAEGHFAAELYAQPLVLVDGLVAVGLGRPGLEAVGLPPGLQLDRHVGQVHPAVVYPLEGERLAGESGEALARQPDLHRVERRDQHVDAQVELAACNVPMFGSNSPERAGRDPAPFGRACTFEQVGIVYVLLDDVSVGHAGRLDVGRVKRRLGALPRSPLRQLLQPLEQEYAPALRRRAGC